MSKISPDAILNALKKAEDDAEIVEKKFLDKVKTYENVNVGNMTNI